MVVWYNDLESLVLSELDNRRFGLVLVWTRYTSDSKTDLWDDPEIRTIMHQRPDGDLDPKPLNGDSDPKSHHFM